jgi:hypothetical protein
MIAYMKGVNNLATAIDLLRHLNPRQKEKLRVVCNQIDALQGHCKSNYDIFRLQALYQKRTAIIRGA